MTLSACAVALGAMGAGEWSLDHALDVTFEGFAGLVTTLAVGGGGALVLLALCWRPPAPAPTEAS
ncbi:MAG: hypothetical protein M5U14_08780 [Acidimicrobiia bacterium]|nr:hypothetical protein [Acidimicrobiia bacterium]